MAGGVLELEQQQGWLAWPQLLVPTLQLAAEAFIGAGGAVLVAGVVAGRGPGGGRGLVAATKAARPPGGGSLLEAGAIKGSFESQVMSHDEGTKQRQTNSIPLITGDNPH